VIEDLPDLPDRYQEYLERWKAELGDMKPGAFAKYNGKLIKKMTFEEFTPAYVEYMDIVARYQDSLDRGDTINNLVIKLLREQSANLVMKPPIGV
jgi:hypothetical protein